MKLRPYQERVLNELQSKIEAGDKEIVIAAAPSSGKTFMAIQHIKRHPELSFLILTHGTNVLKDQWEKELEIQKKL
jgi:superfamily II DNA or RNA helicase